MRLLSHLRGEDDLLEAWVRHHRALGVTSVHVVAHGGAAANPTLYELARRHPITIEEAPEGPFHVAEKTARLQRLAERFRGEWLLLLDGDEFLAVPYGDLAETTRRLTACGALTLEAPLLQRVRADGTLDTPARIADPATEFPLAVPGLLARMGSDGSEAKFPLFRAVSGLKLAHGHHAPPYGHRTPRTDARGVSHHFKWRRPLLERLRARLVPENAWRHESEAYLAWIQRHDGRLPLEGAFPATPEELVRRGLLRGASFGSRVRAWWRHVRRRPASSAPPSG